MHFCVPSTWSQNVFHSISFHSLFRMMLFTRPCLSRQGASVGISHSCRTALFLGPRGHVVSRKSVVSPDTFTEKIRNWGGRCAAPCAIEIHLKNNTSSINIERRTPLCVPSTWFFQVFRNNSRTRCLRSTRFSASASLSLSASFKTTFTAIHALDTIFRIF